MLATLIVLAAPGAGLALELPVRVFTTEDGLGDNRVNRIVPDSRGLLWICTNGGISRFDGSQFQSFGVAEGLPFPVINDLLETADGDFWLASNGTGVIRFTLSSAAQRYDSFLVDREPTANRVNRLFRSPDGAVWVGTDGGLFRMTVQSDGRPDFRRVPLRRQGHPDEMVQVWAFATDRDGALWVGTRFGLVRLLRDGRIISYTLRQGGETDHVYALLYAPDEDVLWIAHQDGLAIFKPPPAWSHGEANHGQTLEEHTIVRAAAAGATLQNGRALLPRASGDAVYLHTRRRGGQSPVHDLLQTETGVMRVVTSDAVFEYSAGRFLALDDPRLHTELAYAAEDRDGNLWISRRAAGILRIARHGFTTFRESDGLGHSVSSVFEDRAGELVVVSQDWRVSRFEGEHLHTVIANLPSLARGAGWELTQRVIEDHRGDWWFATGAGLVRFSGIRRIEDLAIAVPRMYTTRDGLAQESVNRLFEDSHGDIWIGSHIPGRDVLTRWDRASGRFQTYSDADGLRAFNSPTGFYEDPRGVLFVTLRDGGIARYDGVRFRVLSDAEGLPGRIGGAMTDRRGRLWCWGSIGVVRIDNPDAEHLHPVTIANPSWSPGGVIGALAEDAAGSLYISTSKGIVRVDNASTASDSSGVRIGSLYTTGDGLASYEVSSAFVDHSGRLWVGTTLGLSYFDPEVRRPVRLPRIRIGAVRVAGIDQQISPAGQDAFSGVEVPSGRSQLEIAFFGISFAPGDTLMFEYRLRGASEEWSVPSPVRSVMFSNLAPGAYAFEVRAVSATGGRSPQPAWAGFRVLPPIWRRWWFITLAALALLSAMTALERYRITTRREISRAREQRLVELERVRRRIAADLHDEIGSSLTQIAILSEVARQQGARAVPELSHPLSLIASSSRELIDAMSDIVWAINPAKDHLADLTQRMRRTAADAFTATGTMLRLELPPPDQEIPLGANLRREVFLIFKEALNNIVKHSASSEVVVKLAVDGAVLRLELHDNGRGFDPQAPADGHGLASLRNRAQALGASVAIVSAPAAGTSITLDLPINYMDS
jgi:signal transduction histidine kinase/sugar lactone lactonase YvrE